MKFLSGRKQDIRDIFMLSNLDLDKDLILENLNELLSDKIIEKRVKSIKSKIKSQDFRNALQGVYGYLPDNTFDNCRDNLLEILDKLKH